MHCCEDLQNIINDHPELFKKHSDYGVLITWLELSEEVTFTKKHNYGVPIRFCPFCGERLRK